MILADTSIFVMIFSILYYSGILNLEGKKKGEIAKLRGLEFQVSLTTGSPGGSPQFLVVKNNETNSRMFPESEGPFALLRATRKELDRNGKVLEERNLTIPVKVIAPEERGLYRLENPSPESESFVFYFLFQDGREFSLRAKVNP